VVGKDLARNILLVAQGHDHPLLYGSSLLATPLTWVLGRAPAAKFRCEARCRHRQPLQACTVALSADRGAVRVRFDRPQRAVTPGQSVVFYRDGECLGGGVIDHSEAD
jgi:tRNA-specific 2-thiouridylase